MTDNWRSVILCGRHACPSCIVAVCFARPDFLYFHARKSAKKAGMFPRECFVALSEKHTVNTSKSDQRSASPWNARKNLGELQRVVLRVRFGIMRVLIFAALDCWLHFPNQ